MRVALDAMGGDSAPDEIVAGALLSREEPSHPEIVLVGDEGRLGRCLAARGAEAAFPIAHAPEVVEMHESPVEAIRRKRRSSILQCVRMVRDREADAVVSAGNTGAAVAACTLLLRTIPGIRRPGIAVTLPTITSRGCTVLDVGANIHAKPIHLFQYGLMASHYARSILGIPRPSIGLLNIGEEDEKGTELVRSTHALFEASDLNFTGNVEGQDIFRGAAEIVVCEGFVGNVVLKASEGVAETFLSFLQQEAAAEDGAGEAGRALRALLGRLDARVSYSEVGGALLLGVEGVCIIAHGRSNAKAIASAIRLAGRFIQAEVTRHIAEGVRLAGERIP